MINRKKIIKHMILVVVLIMALQLVLGSTVFAESDTRSSVEERLNALEERLHAMMERIMGEEMDPELRREWWDDFWDLNTRPTDRINVNL